MEIAKEKQLLIGDEFGDYYILNEEEYTLQFTINNPYASAIMYNNVLVGAALIDSKLTNELILEGLARDIVRSIQKIRKDSNFSITDHISVTIQTENNQLHKAIEYWEHYIKQQTLSDNILVTHIQQNIAEECYYSVTKDNNACIFIKKVDHKL